MVFVCVTLVIREVGAQSTPTAPPVPVHSIGQPPRLEWYTAGLGLVHSDDGGGAVTMLGGVRRALTNPVLGIASAGAEGYAAVGGSFDGGGLRALASAPVLALSTGLDWNLGSGRRGRVDWMLSYRSAIRRGGLFGRGTMLRVDWLPTRRSALGIGVTVPLNTPLAGRTRPRSTAVRLPRTSDAWRPAERATLSPMAGAALARVRAMALVLRTYTSVYSRASERRLTGAPPYRDAMSRYLTALTEAFTPAGGDARLANDVTTHARALALNGVLIPYDALFGQAKKNAGSIRDLTSSAQARFTRWLRDSSGVSPDVARQAAEVNWRWLGILEDVHHDALADLGDSRLVWLPLRLALAPDDYDEQREVDAIIERLVGRSFSDQNTLNYLRSIDLPLEIARSIIAARDYHVLWTHDFAGWNDAGAVDNVAYDMVADAYLPALTAAVRAYDTTGRVPTYMVMIDQYFYEPRNGRMWMTILEDPLEASMRLPPGNADREAHLRQRQAELRQAVAASARLQRDAASSGGSDWIRRIVKVHVNVTQPSDFSFRSDRILPVLPFTPDNIMRDHRKIVMYDVSEADPYRGATMLMGIGIGEHYSSASWEDRGYRLRGPAALEARAALRRELLRNGYTDSQIPPPLREVRDVKIAERQMNVGDYVGRALQVHNEVGFGPKMSSVSRAALYDLAAPGSVVIAPDPLWLSADWAGMLVGAAARGARVAIIAPARTNAPSPEAPLMALSHDVLTRAFELQSHLAAVLERSGGTLRIGIYAGRAKANDAGGRRREVREGLARAPWIRELIPFDQSTLAVLDRAEARAASDGQDASPLASDAKPRLPQLHQKTQLIARPGAIAALVRQPGWDTALASVIEAQSAQTARFAEQLGTRQPATEDAATRGTDALLRGYEQALSPDERTRVSFYFTVGTQNQDPRGLVSDGEATLITSGFQGATGLVDLYFLMARTTWITKQGEIDRLVPPQSGVLRRLAHLFRYAL